MRLHSTVNDFISDDGNGQQPLLGDSNVVNALIENDAFSKYTGGRFSVSGGGTETLAFGDITTADGFFVRATGDLNVVINTGASEVQALRKKGSVTYAKIHMDCEVTAIQLTNPGTDDVTGDWAVWAV